DRVGRPGRVLPGPARGPGAHAAAPLAAARGAMERHPGGGRAGRALAGCAGAGAVRRAAGAAGGALAVEPAPVRPRPPPPRHARLARRLAALPEPGLAAHPLGPGDAGRLAADR